MEAMTQTGKCTERFSREQAQSKLGRRVRSVVDLPEIPRGTTGCVMEMDEIEQGAFELIVEWSLRISGKLHHDWFSKEDYERCLIDA